MRVRNRSGLASRTATAASRGVSVMKFRPVPKCAGFFKRRLVDLHIATCCLLLIKKYVEEMPQNESSICALVGFGVNSPGS